MPLIRRHSGRHVAKWIFALALAVVASETQADQIVAVPTNWRLQDYADNSIHLWYTTSTCSSGLLLLPASAPDGSKDRLWSIILTAKVSNRPIGIFYHVQGTDCIIDSFYMDGPS